MNYSEFLKRKTVVAEKFGIDTTDLKLNTKAISVELNTEYFNDGLFYLKAIIHKLAVPTLFDITIK